MGAYRRKHWVHIIGIFITESAAPLLSKTLRRCYRKCCTIVTESAALVFTENAVFSVSVYNIFTVEFYHTLLNIVLRNIPPVREGHQNIGNTLLGILLNPSANKLSDLLYPKLGNFLPLYFF